MYLTRDDKHDVMLLCLTETCLAAVINRARPKTLRYNKLLAAVEQIKQADATYSGTLSDADFAEAEAVFASIETYINRITLEEPCQSTK